MVEIYRFKRASTPIKIAIVSFFIGTILFMMYVFRVNHVYLVFGSFFFILIAILVNLISIIYLIKKWIINPKTRIQTVEEIAIVLANIPIAILYFFIIFI